MIIYIIKLTIRVPIMIMVYFVTFLFLCVEMPFTWAFNAKSALWDDVTWMWKDLWRKTWRK